MGLSNVTESTVQEVTSLAAEQSAQSDSAVVDFLFSKLVSMFSDKDQHVTPFAKLEIACFMRENVYDLSSVESAQRFCDEDSLLPPMAVLRDFVSSGPTTVMAALCSYLLELRYPGYKSTPDDTKLGITLPAVTEINGIPLPDLMCIRVRGNRNVMEAYLVALMLDTFLQKFELPCRSFRAHCATRFLTEEDKTITLEFSLTREEGQMLAALATPPLAETFSQKLEELKQKDPILVSCFCSQDMGLNEYTAQKNIPPAYTGVPADVIKVLFHAQRNIGSGSLMMLYHALVAVIAKLPSTTPVHIHVILVEHGQPMRIDMPPLPPHVTVTFLCANDHWVIAEHFWYALGQAADVAVNFCMGPICLPEAVDGPLLVFTGEYQRPLDVVPGKLKDECGTFYNTGFNCNGFQGIGIIHPSLLPWLSLEERRACLAKQPETIILFNKNPDAPLYFGYVATPSEVPVGSSSAVGLDLLDSFAIFVMHTQLSGQQCSKIVLPITVELIDRAIEKYPAIFRGYTREVTADNIVLLSKENSVVEVFNLFPICNATFRQLCAYALSSGTPVIATGDQSLIELFFNAEEFIFLYQTLRHKLNLIDALITLSQEAGLTHTNQLLVMTRSIDEDQTRETVLQAIVIFIHESAQQLREESRKLIEMIRGQPNLADFVLQKIQEARLQENSIPWGAAAALWAPVNSRATADHNNPWSADPSEETLDARGNNG